jgi:hypothetical protein
MAWWLGLGWGLVAALPFVAIARRVAVRAQLSAGLRAAAGARAARPVPARGRRPHQRVGIVERPPIAVVANVARGLIGRRAARREADLVARQLPLAVDLLAVAVGAGHTPYVALEVTGQWCPEPLQTMLGTIRAAHELGVGLDEALRRAGRAHDALRPLTDTLRTSTRLGAPVAPALVRLGADVRAELRRRAEIRARRVPVRLLFPLVFLVLPAFALLTVAPVVLAGFDA